MLYTDTQCNSLDNIVHAKKVYGVFGAGAVVQNFKSNVIQPRWEVSKVPPTVFNRLDAGTESFFLSLTHLIPLCQAIVPSYASVSMIRMTIK